MKRLKHPIRTAIIIFAVLYIVSYLSWSRMAIARAEQTGSVGFYFVEPDGSAMRHWANAGVVTFYFPLVVIENWVGTGMSPGKKPLRNVTRS